MEEDLNFLKEIQRLKRASTGKNELDISKLEEDFMMFSSYAPKRAFTVKPIRLHKIKGEEQEHLSKALVALDIKTEKLPSEVDITGAFDINNLENIILLSKDQMDVDHIISSRSYLNPLIYEVYTKGMILIRDFSIHEALIGKVIPKVGNLPLNELPIFPERFIPGKYTLHLHIDTPENTITKFVDLVNKTDEIKKDPKIHLLNPIEIKSLTDLGLELRKRLGSLSRYSQQTTQDFETATNSCIIRNKDSTLYYLYSEKQKRNVLIYFGQSPFDKENEPSRLIVLNGENSTNVIRTLLDLEILRPSSTVLGQRIEDLKKLYDNASRGYGRPLNSKGESFSFLQAELQKTKRYFDDILNKDMRREYAKKLQPELLEFIVYPDTEDPMLYEILNRVSWNKNIREYSDTVNFINKFGKSNDKEKKQILEDILSSLIFKNHQNNDVNTWLYANYQEFCKKNKFEFELIQ